MLGSSSDISNCCFSSPFLVAFALDEDFAFAFAFPFDFAFAFDLTEAAADELAGGDELAALLSRSTLSYCFVSANSEYVTNTIPSPSQGFVLTPFFELLYDTISFPALTAFKSRIGI